MRRRMRRHLRAGRYVRKVIMRLRRAVVLDADAQLDVVNAMMVRHYVLGRVFDTNEYWESLQQAWEGATSQALCSRPRALPINHFRAP